MLDIKSKLVLKILIKECPNGAYKIVESKDIISSMPNKYRADNDGLDNILIYLERQEIMLKQLKKNMNDLLLMKRKVFFHEILSEIEAWY